MSSKDNETKLNDVPDRIYTTPKSQATLYVWIVYTHNIHLSKDWPQYRDILFDLKVSKGSTIITSTKEVASEMVELMADKLAAEFNCERQQVRDSGAGVQDDGDLCCDVTKLEDFGRTTTLRHLVYAWKVDIV
jgi:hypothetical protein